MLSMFDKFCAATDMRQERDAHVLLHNDIFRILTQLDASTTADFVEGRLYEKIANELCGYCLLQTDDKNEAILHGVELSLGDLQHILMDAVQDQTISANALDAFIIERHHALTSMIVNHIHPPIAGRIKPEKLRLVI